MALSRAMALCGCPPMLVKSPPTKILPSAWAAIERTRPLAFGSNESAKPLADRSGRCRCAAAPPMLVKSPPTRILPSAWIARERTSCVRTRDKRMDQTGRRIQPGYAISRLSADVGIGAARQNFAVRLHGNRIDGTVCVRVDSKSSVPSIFNRAMWLRTTLKTPLNYLRR